MRDHFVYRIPYFGYHLEHVGRVAQVPVPYAVQMKAVANHTIANLNRVVTRFAHKCKVPLSSRGLHQKVHVM